MPGGMAPAEYSSANMVAALTPAALLKVGSHLSSNSWPPSAVCTS